MDFVTADPLRGKSLELFQTKKEEGQFKTLLLDWRWGMGWLWGHSSFSTPVPPFSGLQEGAGRRSRLLWLSFRESLNLLFPHGLIESVPFPFSRVRFGCCCSPGWAVWEKKSRWFLELPLQHRICFPIPQLRAALAASGDEFVLPHVEWEGKQVWRHNHIKHKSKNHFAATDINEMN